MLKQLWHLLTIGSGKNSSRPEGGRSRFFKPLPALLLFLSFLPVMKAHAADQAAVPSPTISSDIRNDELRGAAERLLAKGAELLGPFPFQGIVVAETVPPDRPVAADALLVVPGVVRPELAVARAIAGGWFGDAAWREGLAVFLAGQLLYEDPAARARYRKELLLAVQDGADHSRVGGAGSGADEDERSGGSAFSAAPAPGEAARDAMEFHMLMRRIGEPIFFAALREAAVQSRQQPVDWPGLQQIFAARSGDDGLGAFFEAWGGKADPPAFKVANLRLDEQEGRPRLKFSLVKQGERPGRLAVPLKIVAPGEEMTETVVLEEAEKELTYSFADPPTELVVDEGYDLLRQLDDIELPPSWQRYQNAPRRLIIGAIGTAEKFEPLLSTLKANGAVFVEADKVTDAELAAAAILLLGADTAKTQALFAGTVHPETGITVDVRHHPFNPGRVAVILSAESAWQVRSSLESLVAHGDADYLHVKSGVVREKRLPDSIDGLRYLLDMPPGGMEVRAGLSFAEIVSRLAAHRVVYVGEVHTRNEDHRLQLRVIRALHRRNPGLAIGMEMFPRDVQEVLDSYVAGKMDEREFLKKSAYFKNWGYDYRLYREIIDFARHNKIPIVGLNIRKEVVSKVFKEGGISALAAGEQESIAAERNLDMPGYRQRLEQVFAMHDQHARTPEQINDFFQAQSVWDETMAESVAGYLKAHPDSTMVVVAGMGHTVKESGIPPRVARRVVVPQAVVLNSQEREVGEDAADFVVFSPPEPLPPSPLLGVMVEDGKEGLPVKGVSADGPAMRAGLKEDDLIVALDGKPISEVEDLKIALLYKNRGDKVSLEVRRVRRLWPDLQFSIDVLL